MGSNGNKTYVEIDLDGKTRQLKYDFNALAKLEDTLNLSGFLELNTALKNPGATQIRAFLWAGLLHSDKDIGIHEVGATLKLDNVNEYAAKIIDAINLAFGFEGDDEDAPEQGEAKASTEKEKT